MFLFHFDVNIHGLHTSYVNIGNGKFRPLILNLCRNYWLTFPTNSVDDSEIGDVIRFALKKKTSNHSQIKAVRFSVLATCQHFIEKLPLSLYFLTQTVAVYIFMHIQLPQTIMEIHISKLKSAIYGFLPQVRRAIYC